jgi:GH15 family glucan-1,4-alpha-glucosidase
VPEANFEAVTPPTGKTRFFPIGEFAFVSDCHTCALSSPDGWVQWLCVPRFDSPAIFAGLLDHAAGGWRVGPYGIDVPLGRRYVPGTNVLETTWMTPTGWLLVREGLVIGPWSPDESKVTPHTRPPTDLDAEHMLIREVTCIQGTVEVEVVCEPMFDYARAKAVWTPVDESEGLAADASDGTTTVRLAGNFRLGIEESRARARHTMHEGEKAFSVLSWAYELRTPESVEDASAKLDQTEHYWRTWLAQGRFPDHPLRAVLQRSALVLKGLSYAPTGAMLAAATTSLPETLGGERNWDYRYCWMRDSTFTLYGLHSLGLDWEADDFMQFMADLERNDDGSLQIMYGINGDRDLTEQTLDHLRGYENSRPVRIGNGAFSQRQNDVYGAVLDSVYIHTKRHDHIPPRLLPLLYDQARVAEKVWKEPDQGIWEARGKPRHYVSSKLMCWVALDRAARLAEIADNFEQAAHYDSVAEEIRADILAKGVSDRGVFRQHYDTDALDASTLLVVLNRFLPPDDERVRNTVLAIDDELTEHGYVLRYRTEETDDGLHGEEGTFLICSFWMVSALSEIGERERARALCDRLLAAASPLGLYAEELDAASGRHLGNYPQAFTHLALINAVDHIIADEKAAEREAHEALVRRGADQASGDQNASL